MSRLVKLLGSGIGLTSEAIHAARSRSPSGQPSSPSSNDSTTKSTDHDLDNCANLLPSNEHTKHAVNQKDGKKKKAGDDAYDSDGDSSELDDLRGFQQDEALWELDEMTQCMILPSYEQSMVGLVAEPEKMKVKQEDDMARRLVQMAGPPPQPVRRIHCPVVIPQRRPRQKDRGFVRAYAPVLSECGVSQQVFLQFLSDFDKASKASPLIDVVFVAAGIVGFVPEAAAQVVSTVIQIAAGAARELQSRHRRNTFLDRINQDLLMPRGLYAMVMAFKDEVSGQQQGRLSKLSNYLGQTLFTSGKLDINQTAAKYSNPEPSMSRLQKGLKDIRLSSGKTHGEIELPDAAALIYPDLDQVAAQALGLENKDQLPEVVGMREKFRYAGTWVQDYLDRRAQAFYEAEHQDSCLVVPYSQRAPMTSRFSDPSHPANSGSVISLLTGGAIHPANRRNERRVARQGRRSLRHEHRDVRRATRGQSPIQPRRPYVPRSSRRDMIRKTLQQDVLYLLVVNLPSQEETQDSVAQLERVMQQASASAFFG